MRVLLWLFVLPALVRAQNTSSVLSGTLLDPGGAAIPAATISLTSDDKGFVRTATTNQEGFFSFPDLTPATFTLSIQASGFKAYRQTGLMIQSSERRSLGQIRLELGELAETVTVNADAVAVNTMTGDKTSALNAQELDKLALRGRDVFDAVSLMPGVVDTSDGRDAPGPTSIANIYIAGGRNDQKNMTIDGVTNLDTGSNVTVHQMPSMDSVAELKVLTSNYAAEYGRNSGGTVTVITKGGGKQFHGSGNWYYRHENLNANDFFANVAGRQKAPYRYNIAGYTIGGPVLLPRINPGRNKLFFFFSQEFQRQKVQFGVKTVTVPTEAERGGDFTRTYDTNGALVVIRDPQNARQPFPGNSVPASRINAVGQAVLKIFPLPNYRDPNPSRVYQWNYYANQSGAYPRRTEILRVDYSPRANWQVYARLSNNADSQSLPYAGGASSWVAGSLNFPLTTILYKNPGRGAVLHSTNVITPTVFNELVLGISQNGVTFRPDDYSKVDRIKLGIDIPQRNPSLNPNHIIPNMTFAGKQNYANPTMDDRTPHFNRNTIYSLVDNLSKIWKTHTFKTGVYLERTRKLAYVTAAIRGIVRFDRDTVNNILDSNDAYSNALLGVFDSYAEANARPMADWRFRNYEFYAQDTWKASRRLSLDVGVRFYSDPPQYEHHKYLHSFLPSLYNAAQAPVLLRPANVGGTRVAVDPRNGNTYPAGLIGTYAPGSGDGSFATFTGGKDGYPDGLYSLPTVMVAPRIGFAFDPMGRGRTAIRGGFGVFFDRMAGNPTNNTVLSPPVVSTPTNYYGTFADIQTNVSSGLMSPSGTVYALFGDSPGTSAYNFSLSLQQQFGRATLAEVSYVGNLGRHLVWSRNINPVPLGSTFLAINPQNRDSTTNSAYPANFLRPYQGYADIMLYELAGTSNYNSLQASFAQRWRRGITIRMSYTFSKVLDASDSYSGTVDPFYSPRSRNYGPAGFDRSHVYSAQYTWALPRLGKGMSARYLRWVVNHWEISGITRMSSGAPLTPGYSMVTGIDFTGSTSADTRVYVLKPDAPAAERFNPPVWSAPNVPTRGNVGKGVLRGPGVNNWDISLYRNFLFREGRIRGQLRFETYNTFNHTQYSAYDTTLRFALVNPQPDAGALNKTYTQINPLFMQPTAARPPRRCQLSVRLSF